MDYSVALAAVRGLENGAELASAIEGKVSELETKNYQVIGEKRTETQKRQAMQQALESIGKSIGIEGDVDAVLDNAQGKIQNLVSERDAATSEKETLEQAKLAAEQKVSEFQTAAKLSEAATKAGADPKVLTKLLGDKAGDIAIDGDTVKLGDKSLKEYVEGDDELKLFIPSLFPDGGTPAPGTNDKSTSSGRLPSGPPAGANDNKTDPLAGYVGRTYTPPKALTKTS